MTSTLWAVPCALCAAACFGGANVVQMREARRTQAGSGIDPRLLLRLARDRWWLLALAASALGFLLQATALFLAPVVLVQPLIVTELLFALPLAAALAGTRLSRREWAGILLVAAGLAGFLLAAQPAGGRTTVSARSWTTMIVGVAIGVAVLAALAETQRSRAMLRASLLSLAASACFGLMAVLTRTVGHEFDNHGFGALARPQPWLLGAVAAVGLLLVQTAFRVAPLSVSLPLIDFGEPFFGSLLAVVVFGESLGTGPGVLAGAVIGALMVAGGVALLDTSPLVQTAQRELTASTADAHHDGQGQR